MTQEEIIVWHKYPYEKPRLSNETYLVCVLRGERSFSARYEDGDFWSVNYGFGSKKLHVIAYAELPKGWQDNEKVR
jgi:hypothetical protein